MTISSETRKVQYTGNGATTVLAFSFKVFSTADVYVVLTSTIDVDVVQVLTTDYTVSLNADQDASPGGSVTMLTAPPTGYVTTISSDIAYLQETDLTNQGGFYPRVISNALDRLTIFCQQLAGAIALSLRMPFSTPSTFNSELPIPAANEYLMFNAAADGFTSGPIVVSSSGTASVNYYTDSGTANAYVLTPGPGTVAPDAYYTGMIVEFVTNNENTGASTINVNGLGNKAIGFGFGDSTAIGAKTIMKCEYVGARYVVNRLMYDGTRFAPCTMANNFSADGIRLGAKASLSSTSLMFGDSASSYFSEQLSSYSVVGQYVNSDTTKNFAYTWSNDLFNGYMSGSTSGTNPVYEITKTTGYFSTLSSTSVQTKALEWTTSTVTATVAFTSPVITSANIKSTGIMEFASYAKASLPVATTAARMIYVTDEVGGAVMAFSDGTNWRRVTDRAIVS